MSGLIKDSDALEFLQSNHKIGDIIDVEVIEDFSIKDYEDTILFQRRPVIKLGLPSNNVAKRFQSSLLSCLAGANDFANNN